MSATVLVSSLGLVSAGATQANAASFPAECPWMNTSLTADQRAQVLLDNSTLDQKIRWLNEQSANNPAQTVFSIGGGLTTTMPRCRFRAPR